MAWENSDRSDRLPPDWQKIRRQVGKRDGWVCQWHTSPSAVCGEPGREIDHIRPGDDHSPANLRVLCQWHHSRKSGIEGARASAARRREIHNRFRRSEEHPGRVV